MDHGPGIESHILSRLFLPCNSTQGGNGLGLAISKQLANQLGATLELKSNDHDGCVFALRLPGQLLIPDGQSAVAQN
jgi:C4-dicarboxylate-specific signal transduction histidine kinase